MWRILLFLLLVGCGPKVAKVQPPVCETPEPPVAERREHVTEIHGVELRDPYRWLRERENPEVTRYLEAENAYSEVMMNHTEELQERLYEEMLSHVKETDESAPYRHGGFWYYTRTEEGKNYEIYCRKKGELSALEEVLLDENALAADNAYFAVGALEMSPDHRLMAFSTDTLGNERYNLFVKDLETGEIVDGPIENTYYSVAWANDNKTLFYNRVDDATRPHQLWRHVVGTDPSQDVLVYEEKDERFFLGINRSRSDRHLLLNLMSAVTSEWRYLSADDPTGEFRVIKPREQNVEYYVDHHPGPPSRFYVLTNDEAVNFRVYEANEGDDEAQWKEIIAPSETVTLARIDVFAGHLLVWERRDGLPTARVIDLGTSDSHQIEFPEPTYAAWAGDNYEFETPVFRFEYTSLTTPPTVFDYQMGTRELTRVKEREVPNFDRTLYETARLEATAPDGTKVPISVVWRKDALKKPAPLLLSGYGSYGSSYDPYFSSSRLALLDRGVVFAIAHVRGGGEMGRKWYEDGKYLKKKNTFTDFIACAEHLAGAGWTTPDRLAITGRSAGGLLMGAVTNMRPDLFEVVVAGVPFVDVTNTMLDPTIPLTVIEWEEWGNPQDREYFEYMRSYAPYDNVRTDASYPDMLITAGLNDPRVAYWEPAKWTAKLRTNEANDSLILLQTNMGAGHGGASGRYDYLKELAFEYAFILDRLAVVELRRCK